MNYYITRVSFIPMNGESPLFAEYNLAIRTLIPENEIIIRYLISII